MRRPFAPWADCLLWILTGWVAGLMMTVAGIAIERTMELGTGLRILLNPAPNLVGTGVVILLGLSAARDRPKVVLSIHRPPWGALPWITLSSLCLALLIAELNTWIDQALPMPPSVQELFRQVLEYQTPLQLAGVLLFLVLVAPATEELMFRGLFLHRLSEAYGHRRAILGSALCFGIFHILPWQAVGAALMGLYFGWLVVRTGSIFTAILAHAIFNLVPVVATGLGERIPLMQALGAEPDPTRAHFPLLILAGAALALAAGILGTIRSARPAAASPSNTATPNPSPGVPSFDR